MNKRALTFLVIVAGAGFTMWAISKREKPSQPEATQPEATPEVAPKPEKKDTMEFTEQITGLQYHIMNHGTGDTTPSPGQAVEVHYTGWLDNGGEQGAKFDSSVDRGQPFTFVVGAGQVIKGWDETLLEMREGEKRYIIMAPELGYGAGGAGRAIPGNATLRFEVELLKIKG